MKLDFFLLHPPPPLYNDHLIVLQIQADQVDGVLSAYSSVAVPQFDRDHDQ